MGYHWIYRDAMPQRLILHVLLFKERVGPQDVWVAQCLEHDITAQGDTVREAQKDFERTVRGEIVLALEAGREPLAGIAPAPSRYQDLWELAVRLADSIVVTPSPDLGPTVGQMLGRVPRAEAEFRLAG